MLLNGHAARIVDRHLTFREGTAYGIDHLLEPPGLGAHCDMLENRTTYVSKAPLQLGPTRREGATEFPFSSCLRDPADRAKDFYPAPSDTTTR